MRLRLLARLLAPLVLAFALAPACAGDESEDTSPAAGADAAPGGEKLPFLAECTANEDCATGLCFNFNNKGPHCTHACTGPADCEAPSPGCSGMNVCKAP